ncbi:PTS mannitol transporter subunit IICB [Paenibacillus daejeonensis]|uniref:PTS mannitol transporter subunit IICB n=1 Tax=Paenibacillus daejeonensis TaxID=135193 RepID=UPI000369516A|nr:PTS mannitol transporter subunit IICBA [Paenibacillus daejeonensis]
MTNTEQRAEGGGIRVRIQRFGRFLSGMVMPNMGAFIAWGLITALFIPDGWWPSETLAELVDPMLYYLLPLLIGFTGGKMIHDMRGGVIGAVVTVGVIVGTDIPMFLGAMIVGPLAAWILKQFDRAIDGKVPSGFEMLVNNFSAGIIGAILSIGALLGAGPAIQFISRILADSVGFLIDNGLLPLANILIEPGKVLFLNNAINHGVLGPIALQQSDQLGKSIVFLLESNPGPGLGILLAYMIAGRGSARQSASGAAVIQFAGGIHEIYFPYILMNPRLIVAAIAGGVTGSFTFSLLNAGLVATASPGSIFAYVAMAPRGELLPVLAGVLTATVASFLVAFLILKTTRQKEEEASLESAQQRMSEMKGKGNATPTEPAGAAASVQAAEEAVQVQKGKDEVRKIIVSCDAGMGSSAMGASVLRKKMKTAGIDVHVSNTAISDIPADADIVVTHRSLTDRARQQAPQAEHISIDNFMKSPEYDKLVERLS